ncbi:hypothetical protein I302_106541 [Kwoniella bestiolae CBS 10118]|uniref:RRM domain-containing protein n=1 Tax=Kwoniella bestiolae CBS 10118 TaxID=1296100 RepID=A0A1B9G150_9TREE|nr:hypothetical protein I302_06199 [Kwoniella bestiolae CBS 10118]OCF24738.1 hypothetical protein I302_06199 [Kwoniella bestiolae CBS 10118]
MSNYPPPPPGRSNGFNPFPKYPNRPTGSSYPPHAGMARRSTSVATQYTNTKTPVAAEQKKDADDGWGEATEDKNDGKEEKLDWSEMPVDTPIMTNRPEIGGSPHQQKNNSINSIPSAIQLQQTSSTHTEDDGGWVSGYAATTHSPPSQPFHQARGQKYPIPTSQSREARSPPFSSRVGGEYIHAQAGSDYRLSTTPITHDNNGLSIHSASHPTLQTSRGFRTALSGALANPPVPSPIYPHQPNELMLSPQFQPQSELTSQVQVPTYTAPITGPPRQQIAGLHDANRIPVPHAKQWGKPATPEPEGTYEDAHFAHEANQAKPSIAPPPHNPMWSDIGDPGQASWDKEDRLARWADSVPPIPPTHQDTPHTSIPPSEAEVTKAEEEEEAASLSRISTPDGKTTPIIGKYSPEQEEKTPALTPHGSASPVQEDSEVVDPASVSLKKRLEKEKAPAILTVAAEGTQLPSTPPSDHQDPLTGPRGRDRNGVDRVWNSRRAYWWKPPPHPMFSPQFAAQRILIQFPFPVRTDGLKQMMLDQFSRYGAVQTVWHYEANGNFCEKAFVVFQDEETVKKVLADPESRICHVKSSIAPGSAPLKLMIKHSSPSLTSRTILIRLTGPRADSRARSASPVEISRDQDPEDQTAPRDQLGQHHLAMLPPRLLIDAVPFRSRDGRVIHRAKIRSRYVNFAQLADQAREETGKEMQKIGEIDLRRRVSEKDIIPPLCDFFAEICDITPPTARGQGWLVTVGGIREARHIMNELQKIPGFFVRWADEGDGYYPIEGPNIAPSVFTEPVTPITRVRNEVEGRPSAANRQKEIDVFESATGDAIANSLPTPVIIQPPVSEVPPVTPINQPVPQYAYPPSGYSPTHPSLRRTFLHTYKGRPLVQDVLSMEERYIDERAIFVGRLVKNAETSATLLTRFGRYGNISSIEYNPTFCTSAYATARVLYQDKDSADRAIVHENGNLSFGSAMKVEKRKVLSSDVQLKEMYIDDFGRAISPSMVSQYSPPASIPEPGSYPAPDPVNPYPTQSHYAAMMPHMQFGMWYHPQLQASMVPPPFTMGVGTAEPDQTQAETMPTAMPTNTAQGAAQLPSSLQLPTLCAAWGIGYLPPGSVPFPLTTQPPTATTSGDHAGPAVPPVPAPEPTTSVPSVNSSIELPGGLSAKSRLNPIGFTNEDGMLKPVYDPNDLKEYCAENNIALPKRTDPTIQGEELTLLPIQTGGHDYIRADQTASKHSIVPNGEHNPISPIFASINDPPRVGNSTTHTRTVPIPIPFSPVGTSQPLDDQLYHSHVSDPNSGREVPLPHRHQQVTLPIEQPLFTSDPLPPHIHQRPMSNSSTAPPRDLQESVYQMQYGTYPNQPVEIPRSMPPSLSRNHPLPHNPRSPFTPLGHALESACQGGSERRMRMSGGGTEDVQAGYAGGW